MVKIIDGKELAGRFRAEIKAETAALREQKKITPKLVVVLVGDDPASLVYVRNKERACADVGMLSDICRIPASIKEKELIDILRRLSRDTSIHGILVQLPLPHGLDASRVLEEVDPAKDIDGLHPLNIGRLFKSSSPLFVPCTPQGIIELILSTGADLRGKEAVVVGRSNIVGKPVAVLLLQKNATVTICHSATVDLGAATRRADILVAAVGSPEIIHGDMIKAGAVIIDVGVNRVGEKLVGDVDFATASERAGYITPVPGGVGPMTIAMLLRNTLKAAQLTTKQP